MAIMWVLWVELLLMSYCSIEAYAVAVILNSRNFIILLNLLNHCQFKYYFRWRNWTTRMVSKMMSLDVLWEQRISVQLLIVLMLITIRHCLKQPVSYYCLHVGCIMYACVSCVFVTWYIHQFFDNWCSVCWLSYRKSVLPVKSHAAKIPKSSLWGPSRNWSNSRKFGQLNKIESNTLHSLLLL